MRMKDLRALKSALEDKIWGFTPEGGGRARLPLWALRLVMAVLRDMREGQFDQRAASLAYTTLLSFAPLLAIIFAVLKVFGAYNALEPSLRAFLDPLGSAQAAEISGKVVGFVAHINVGMLGMVGLAVLFWGVTGLLRDVEEAFNDIWRVRAARSFLQRLRDYTGVLVIGPLSLLLSVTMTATLRHAGVFGEYLHIDITGGAFEAVFSIVPYLLFMLAFAALYMFMPNTQVKPAPALAAGFITGVIWKVLGKLFGLLVAGSASYAAVYSAFAALVLFVLWIYAGWLTVLAGAAICYYLQNPSNQPLSRKVKNLSLRFKEMLALQICADVGASFYREGHGQTLAAMALKAGVPALAVEDVAEDLTRMGILAQTGARGALYIPGRPFDETAVADMIAAIRKADESGVLRLERAQQDAAVQEVLAASDAGLRHVLGAYSLKDLALGEDMQEKSRGKE